MTVLGTSNAFPGIPAPQHLSGQSTVQNYLYPGAIQLQATVTVLKSSEAFLGIPFPQHLSGQSTVQSFIFPGALQPIITTGVAPLGMLQMIANFSRRVTVVGY